MLFHLGALAIAIYFGISVNSPSSAADLGGDCCADLEERVAELEATTARKGHAKVSLKISGLINKSIMFWDDGGERNAYIVDPNVGTLSTNFTFSGSAKISSEWSAGYRLTIGVLGAAAPAVTQVNDNAGSGFFGVISSMWIKSNQLGKLSWGKLIQASDNTALLPDLSGTHIQSNYIYFHGNRLRLRPAGAAGTGGLTNAGWGTFQHCFTSNAGIAFDCNGQIINNVRFDLPTFAGLTLSASWGEDDFWDTALNYLGTWGDLKIKIGAAYSKMLDENYSLGGGGNNGFRKDVDFWQVGASVLHVPTGLFFYGAYVEEDHSTPLSALGIDVGVQTGTTKTPEINGWYMKAGIRADLNPLGKTIFYGEYKDANDGYFTLAGNDICTSSILSPLPACEVANGPVELTGSEVKIWGVGVVQNIDAAALQLFAKYLNAKLDIELIDDDGPLNQDFEDLNVILVGGNIFF